MPMMDVFNNNAFSMTSLTLALEDVTPAPTRVGDMGLFSEQGVTTTTVAIERLGSHLSLVPITPRGGVPIQNISDKRNILNLPIPRLAIADAVYADEVQNVQAFGSETAVQALAGLINQRNARMAQKLDVTLEWHRLGAMRGQILDADGTTVYLNLFTQFGVTAQTEIDMDLDNATPAVGALRRKCAQVIRTTNDALGGMTATGYHAFVGRNFMDDLMVHPQVEATYVYQEGARLRDGIVRQTLTFGGITFEEYDAQVAGTNFVDPDKGLVFPLGVPDLFITYYGPADYFDTVNTVGLTRYANQFADPSGANRFRTLEVQTNPLCICTRPRVMVPIRRT